MKKDQKQIEKLKDKIFDIFKEIEIILYCQKNNLDIIESNIRLLEKNNKRLGELL